MHIRPATSDDLDVLVALNVHVQDLHVAHLPERYHSTRAAEVRAAFAGMLERPDTRIALAVDAEGRAWGYGVILLVARAPTPFVYPIAVETGAPRGGVGRPLMDWAEAQAAALECSSVQLDVLDFNTNAIGFYTHLGYTPLRHRLIKPISAPTP